MQPCTNGLSLEQANLIHKVLAFLAVGVVQNSLPFLSLLPTSNLVSAILQLITLEFGHHRYILMFHDSLPDENFIDLLVSSAMYF